MAIRVRAVGDKEREELARMARSRTWGAGLVRRAQIVLHALEGLKAPEIGARMGLCGATVRHWLKRFNARGLEGLAEDVRTGRPPTYSAEQRSAVINTALTPPADLGLPFASWTLDRLVAYLSERGVAMRRSRISEIFLQEGLRWRREAGSRRDPGFGARVDPDFARKRGRSSSSTRQRRPAASSSASTRWAPKPARATRAGGS
jgi:transposase